MKIEVPANPQLAERARQLANAAGRGPQRRAWLVIAVALDESASLAGARRVLADLDAMGLTDLKHEALQLLEKLARDTATTPEGTPSR